jgi:glutaredoxin
MNIQLYLNIKYNESSFKILKLLDGNNIEFSVLTFRDDDLDKVSSLIGEKVRKLPQVIVDGKRIGGYYDLMEFLMNMKLINYKGVKNDID